MTVARAPAGRVAAEDGYTLTELLTVLLILGTVVGAITGLFVSASRGEVDMNERFRAQQNARLAVAKMRRDVRCARSAVVTATGSGSRVTLAPPSTVVGSCRAAEISWCTAQLAPGRFGLFRREGSTCGASDVKVADHLTVGNVFVYTASSTNSLATLAVDFPVDVDRKDGRATYRLQDTLALRRSGRA